MEESKEADKAKKRLEASATKATYPCRRDCPRRLCGELIPKRFSSARLRGQHDVGLQLCGPGFHRTPTRIRGRLPPAQTGGQRCAFIGFRGKSTTRP